MYRIELLKTHTHANEVHFAGSVIEVDETTTATWLIERGIGKVAVKVDGTLPQDHAATRSDVLPKIKPNRKAKE